MNSSLVELLGKIEHDLGIKVPLSPGAISAMKELPEFMSAFYAVTDGFELPFVDIVPACDIEWNFVDGWHRFGSDGYFSYCLFCEKGIDMWDHEAHHDPAVAYTNVTDLIANCYSEAVEDSDIEGTLVIDEIPATTSLASIIGEIKWLTSSSTPETLQLLKALPAQFTAPRRDA